MAVLPNVIACYELNEATDNDAIDAVSANNAVLTNPSASVSGVISTARNLGGLSYFESTTVPASYPVSLSCWFKTTNSSASYRDPAFFGNHTTANRYWGIQISQTHQVAFSANDSGTAVFIATASAYNDGQWHHAVAISRSATDHQLYVDNKSIGKSSINLGNFPRVTRFNIGALNYGGSIIQFFNGDIDQVAWWNADITDEIWSLYNLGSGLAYPMSAPTVDPLLTGFYAGYHCDEVSGSMIDVLNRFNLTDVNTVSSGVGILNGSRKFTRSNSQYQYSSSNVNRFGDELTFSAWVNILSLPGTSQMILGMTANDGTITNSWSYVLGIGMQGNPISYVSTIGPQIASSITAITTGQWYHIVATFQYPGSSLLYVNGSLVGEVRILSIPYLSWTSGPIFRFSGKTNATFPKDEYFSTYLDGYVDATYIWGKVLSLSEIQRLYNSGAGLLYPFSSSNNIIRRGIQSGSHLSSLFIGIRSGGQL